MDAYLQLSAADQRAACTEGGARCALEPASVEKDFWVCWTLRELFTLPGIGHRLTFKGGTSLSKCYGLIERFSEDIDLVIDRDAFGLSPPAETGIGSNERSRRLEALKEASRTYIHAVLMPALTQRFQATLPFGRPWALAEAEASDGGLELHFSYPTVFAGNGKLSPVVKIEPGARSDIEPNGTPEVQPYLAEVMPGLLGPSRFAVRTVAPERTFWEKAMLLHEANYGDNPPAPKEAWARHYYDLHCLIKAGVGARAHADKDLFAAVHAHRLVFFRKAQAIQEARRPGTLRLRPADAHRKSWKTNYEKMREPYFFSTPPVWVDVVQTVEEFEQRFNRTERS